MIVKDLLAGIIADNLLETEKIGSSAFYWSLPKRVYDAKKKQLEREETNIENAKNEIENLKQKIEENKAIRVENDERKKNLEELAELENQQKEYLKILKDFESKDPEKYEKYINATKTMGQLNDFWVDNIYTIEQWMKVKRPDIEFEKMLIREQGKIWNDDSEKYREEQKIIEERIRMNGIKNGEILRKQIEFNNNRKMKKNSMSSAEYSLNKQEINKIIDSMEDMI